MSEEVKLTKEEILYRLYENKGETPDAVRKQQLDNICNMIGVLPEFDIYKEVPQIKLYLENSDSCTDGDILQIIIDKLKPMLGKHASAVEGNVIEQMNKKTRKLLIAFLVLISIFAIAAVIFAVLHLACEGFLYGWGDKIASAFGTFDFALGALGFILERMDDLKKREFQSVARYAKETGDTSKFANMVINNSTFAWGIKNKVIRKRKKEERSTDNSECAEDQTPETNVDIKDSTFAVGADNTVVDKSKTVKK